MKKIAVSSIIFIILFNFAAASYVYAECYNEDACFKSYITDKDNNNTVIAVNRDTEEVELYWSDKDQDWLKPDKDELKKLQKMYDKKLRLSNMQKRLDKMRSETMYTTNENSNLGSHR